MTTFDLDCRPGVDRRAVTATRRWAEDRAVGAQARERLVCLALAAVEHALRFDPARVAILLRWLDLDRILLDVGALGCSGTARHGVDPCDVKEATPVFDALAQEWGVRAIERGWSLWMGVTTD
ncbi:MULTISPECIES: hypothetical protein [unclassified Nocardioides]|uniref:hypothetical protein n=1 Tax=unclassified Nocardioides TaxID=2615069 RepID=UPI0012E3675E|nr:MULTISPECIES: hypothetical protein [unclassified Nocardioides]